jgi:hypothetical protein
MASPEMSESAASPAAVRESESILAPILVGYRSPERGTSLAAIVSTASLVVPHMTIMRKQMAGRKAVAVAHTREVFTSHDPDREGYSLIARCCDRAPGESPSEAFTRWNWEIGVSLSGWTSRDISSEIAALSAHLNLRSFATCSSRVSPPLTHHLWCSEGSAIGEQSGGPTQ